MFPLSPVSSIREGEEDVDTSEGIQWGKQECGLGTVNYEERSKELQARL